MTATVTSIHQGRAAGAGIGAVELMQRSGLTYRQVDFYCRAGRLHAIGGDRPGTGYARRFTEDEARIAVLLKQLLDVGFTPAAAGELAREHVEAGRVVRVFASGSVLIGARADV